jgi:SnoaL-like domain
LAAPAAPQSVGADAQDALNALFRWSLGYDSRDEALMRSAFTDDSRFVFFLEAGGEPLVFEGIDEVMDLFLGALEGQDDLRRHVTTNPLIERVDRRTVKVTSYLVLISILASDPTPLVVLTTGVYEDTGVKREGLWRIRERILTLDGSSERPPQ